MYLSSYHCKIVPDVNSCITRSFFNTPQIGMQNKLLLKKNDFLSKIDFPIIAQKSEIKCHF